MSAAPWYGLFLLADGRFHQAAGPDLRCQALTRRGRQCRLPILSGGQCWHWLEPTRWNEPDPTPGEAVAVLDHPALEADLLTGCCSIHREYDR